MTTGGDDELGSEEPTKPGGPADDLGSALRNLALALNEVVRDIGESTRLIDQLEAPERNFRIRDLAEKMGELGDIAHDARRTLRDIAQM